MPKPLRGRAGREDRRSELLQDYGDDLVRLLARQITPRPTHHVLYLGPVGTVAFVTEVAPRISGGELLALVYSYDELVLARAAATGRPHVSIINEWGEIPENARYDLVCSVAPYHLGDDYVEQLISTALATLAPGGLFVFAGDRRFDFDRYEVMLQRLATPVTTLATSAHGRVIQAEAAAIKRRGGLTRRV